MMDVVLCVGSIAAIYLVVYGAKKIIDKLEEYTIRSAKSESKRLIENIFGKSK